MKKIITTIIGLTLILPLVGFSNWEQRISNEISKGENSENDPNWANCRFGVGSPSGLHGYSLNSMHIGGYIDWQFDIGADLPDEVDYIRMFRVSDFDNRYEKALSSLNNIVVQNPGGYYIIGNEPDTLYEHQDGVLPEVYAERYYELATRIKKLDPTAKIGYGSIVQATPIRLRYLERSWEELIVLAGGQADASELIDFWSVHSFILNEIPGEWGVGVPPGFEDDYADAVKIENLNDTYSIEIFKDRIQAFRQWMADHNERNKPLWISEFGSLLPPEDPPVGPNLSNVTDEDTTEFMVGAFDYLLSADDIEIGLPADNYRLVQRWFWYSLNDYRYKFGGSLYDPLTTEKTSVGRAFSEYTSRISLGPDYKFSGVVVNPIDFTGYNQPSDFRVDFVISNAGTTNQDMLTVKVFNGEPVGEPVSTASIESIPGCGQEVRIVSVWLNDIAVEEKQWYSASVDPENDLNPYDNYSWFFLITHPN